MLQEYYQMEYSDESTEESWEKINFAIKTDNYAELQRLITEENIDVNIVGARKTTPLHLAAFYGNIKAIDFLMHQDGINLLAQDRTYSTPCITALYRKYSAATCKLLEDPSVLQNFMENYDKSIIYMLNSAETFRYGMYIITKQLKSSGVDLDSRPLTKEILARVECILEAETCHKDDIKEFLKIAGYETDYDPATIYGDIAHNNCDELAE